MDQAATCGHLVSSCLRYVREKFLFLGKTYRQLAKTFYQAAIRKLLKSFQKA